MNSRLRIGIIVAVVGIALIVVGAFAVVRLYRATISQPEEPVQEVDQATIFVVVANRDMPVGTLLQEADVVTKEIPVEYTTRDAIENIADAVNKITKVELVQGEMVLGHNLANPTNVVHDVAYVLSDTHVLMALPATDLISRESIVQTGDIVDILVTYQEIIEVVGEEDQQATQISSITFAAMQRLDITAMVMDIIQEETEVAVEGDGTAVTVPRNKIVIKAYLLALDPQDALILKYFKDMNAIFDFVLRAPTSTGQFNLTPVTSEYLKELYGLEILP